MGKAVKIPYKPADNIWKEELISESGGHGNWMDVQ